MNSIYIHSFIYWNMRGDFSYCDLLLLTQIHKVPCKNVYIKEGTFDSYGGGKHRINFIFSSVLYKQSLSVAHLREYDIYDVFL